jgi:steroid delta-isomerase-like uncharacterized protein
VIGNNSCHQSVFSLTFNKMPYHGSINRRSSKLSIEENKATIRRFYDAWNQRKMDEVVALVSPDFVDHAVAPELAFGREGFIQARALGAKALSDLTIQVNNLLATEDNYVTAQVTIHATQIGPYKGIAATGKRFSMDAISIMRLEGQQLVEHWEFGDLAGLIQQLGASIVS